MESLKQYSIETASKLSDSAGKILAAPLKSDRVRKVLKETIKGGILVGRLTLNALDGPRKEISNVLKEARQETKAQSSAEGKEIPIKTKEKTKNLSEHSIEELYEIAQQYDISGRSEMNKRELIKAIKNKRASKDA